MDKTVIDAVNEFKGEWPDCRVACLHYSNRLSAWSSSVHTYMNHGYQLICISQQFNDLVSQMKTNFGKSTAEDYFVWFALKDNKPTKELEVMDIDWSKAPEGATHYYNAVGCFYRFSANGEGDVFEDNEWFECSDIGRFENSLIEKPTLTYTQAMADNGETVKVGMRFKTGTNLIYTAKLVNSKSVCFEDEDGFLIGITINAPKPLTPPIELIDGKAYQFDIKKEYGKAEGIQGIYSESLLVFQSVGNAFFKSTVDNIQPLTVGEE